MNKEELAVQMSEKYGSPEKQARVSKYMQSTGISGALSYNDNDCTYGIVTTKP